MTITADTEHSTEDPPPTPRRRRRLGVVMLAAAALAAAGLGAGLTVSLGGSSSSTPGSYASAYQYNRSAMGRYGVGSMMGGGGYGWMMGPSGHRWMLGGTAAPNWMRGGALPGFMMGGETDPGTVMGGFFSDAPGPTVSPAEAARLGDTLPAGATADHAANQLTFATSSVQFVVLASPSMPDERFRIAGMANPTVVVPEGATVSIELINADSDMTHGLVVTSPGAASTWMPMMSTPPAFSGAALWLLGESTSAGMHEGTLDFTASVPGTYQYLCPVPGHAEEGMAGTFSVSGS